MTDVLTPAILTALDTMKDQGPRNLKFAVDHHLAMEGHPPTTKSQLLDAITTNNVNDPARVAFTLKYQRWLTAESLNLVQESDSTSPGSLERRTKVFDALGVSGVDDDKLDRAIAHIGQIGHTLILADNWTPWYETRTHDNFYWNNYKETLRKKGFGREALAALDYSTTDVVRRLADPTDPKAYQSKGLVMGYVQSGKTANFAGAIAKAVDVGYKLVIVLTGTIELLRSQTQKRLDKELVGVENVLGGRAENIERIDYQLSTLDRNSPNDRKKIQELEARRKGISDGIDYLSTGDQDWLAGKFLKFGIEPSAVGAPRIIRMTTASMDFQKSQFSDLLTDFKQNLRDRTKPLYDPANLAAADVLFAVVKKNSSTLKKLNDFLQAMSTDLADIPALIIDDEADQASINTKRPKPTADDIERTKINQHISGILSQMPRCQYIAYTATPFANVFVDPQDSADIFPKDFVLALEPSPEYMGAKSYFDLDGPPDDPTPENSNAEAYYRPVSVDDNGEVTDHDLGKAIDAYVLAGAIKLWRREHLDSPGSLQHHTMMVHQAAHTKHHATTEHQVLRVWTAAGHTSARGVTRLRDLWTNDFTRVSAARADGAPIPASFDVLKPFISQAVRKIESGRTVDGQPHPVVVVNGTKDAEYRQADIDFDSHEVWKILVGGTKLSRGFTVEGLTITVYTRVTVAADTLMQMGRWFGYRNYYRDLVRLYLGSEIVKGRRTVDLYETFTSISKDEDEFRDELRQYAEWDEDREPIRPIDVAPMVVQRLPWLRPTGTNKMYNAKIVEKGRGGSLIDLFAMPERKSGANRRNLQLLAPIFNQLVHHGKFLTDSGTPYSARYAILPATEVTKLLDQFEFYSDDSYDAERNFIRNRTGRPEGIDDFIVYLPLLTPKTQPYASRTIPGLNGVQAHILKRQRRPSRHDFSGSSRRQRVAAEIITGKPENAIHSKGHDDLAHSLHTSSRGALMITLAADLRTGQSDPTALGVPVDTNDVVSLLSIAVPYRAAPKGIIARTVRDTRYSPESAIETVQTGNSNTKA